MSLAWFKVFHVVFIVSWFAGLLYLPRLFVYHSQSDNQASFSIFETMEKRLFSIMTIGALLTMVFGFAALLTNPSYYLSQPWMYLKLVLVMVLFAYHIWCWRHIQALKNGTNQYSHKWFRWFNEAPIILLLGIAILVLVRPSF